MRKKVEKFVHECDGCGYLLNEKDMITLDLVVEAEGVRGKIPFHFHMVTSKNDCIRYWMNGPGIMEASLKVRELPQSIKDTILGSMKFRAAA